MRFLRVPTIYVLTSTHNLCFEQKLKQNNVYHYMYKAQFYYIKVGFKGVKII